MIQLPRLSTDDPAVRTQITLTAQLKQMIEQSASTQGQSLSEYLRRAAMLRLYLEADKSAKLAKLADQVVGSVNLSRHPEWRTKQTLNSWIRKLRRQWERK